MNNQNLTSQAQFMPVAANQVIDTQNCESITFLTSANTTITGSANSNMSSAETIDTEVDTGKTNAVIELFLPSHLRYARSSAGGWVALYRTRSQSGTMSDSASVSHVITAIQRTSYE